MNPSATQDTCLELHLLYERRLVTGPFRLHPNTPSISQYVQQDDVADQHKTNPKNSHSIDNNKKKTYYPTTKNQQKKRNSLRHTSTLSLSLASHGNTLPHNTHSPKRKDQKNRTHATHTPSLYQAKKDFSHLFLYLVFLSGPLRPLSILFFRSISLPNVAFYFSITKKKSSF